MDDYPEGGTPSFDGEVPAFSLDVEYEEEDRTYAEEVQTYEPDESGVGTEPLEQAKEVENETRLSQTAAGSQQLTQNEPDAGNEIPTVLKYKSTENFEQLVRFHTRNLIKCEIKGEIVISTVNMRLEEIAQKREEQEAKIKAAVNRNNEIQKQLHFEMAARVPLETEMNNTGTIVNVLTESAASLQKRLVSGKQDLKELQERSDQMLKESKLNEEVARKKSSEYSAKIDELNNILRKNNEDYLNKKQELTFSQASINDKRDETRKQITKYKQLCEEFLEKRKKRQTDLQKTIEKKNDLRNVLNIKQLRVEHLEEVKKEMARTHGEEMEKHLTTLEGLRKSLAAKMDQLNDNREKFKESKNLTLTLIERRNHAKTLLEEHKANFKKSYELLEEKKSKHNNYLHELLAKHQELQDNIGKRESDIVSVIKEKDESLNKIRETKEKLSNISLKDKKIEIKKQELDRKFEENKISLDSFKKQREELEVSFRAVQKRHEETNNKLKISETQLELLKDEHNKKSTELKGKLNEITNKSTSKLKMLTEQFDELKKNTEENLACKRETYKQGYEELEIQLKTEMDKLNSLEVGDKELQEKTKTVTERRDKLRVRLKSLNEEINAMASSDVSALGKKMETAKETFQPVSILKSPGKPPQNRKVTFHPGLNFDSVSDTSAEIFFEGISEHNAATSQTLPQSADEMFDQLMRYSPPVREKSTPRKRPRYNFE